MKKRLYILAFALMLHTNIKAQDSYLDRLFQFNTFANIFGPNSGCLQLTDTSYVIAATLEKNNHYYPVLFAFNMAGDTLWAKYYDYSAVGAAAVIQCTFDKSQNILITGVFDLDSVAHGVEAMLLKVDSLGNFDWLKNFGLSHYGTYQGVYGTIPLTTPDQHYAIAGTLDIDSVNADFLIIKTDTAGNEESRWHYGTEKYESAFTAIQTIDSGFLIAGETTVRDTPGFYLFSIYIVKTDKNGVLLWDTSYAAPYDTSNGLHVSDAVALDVTESNDGYVFCGVRYSYRNYVYPYQPWSYEKAWIAKLNKSDGSIIWERNIGIDEATRQHFYRIIVTVQQCYS